jgi:hypothetical protein
LVSALVQFSMSADRLHVIAYNLIRLSNIPLAQASPQEWPAMEVA